MSTDKESLIKDIEIELENLQRLTKERTELISRLSEKPNFIVTDKLKHALIDFFKAI